ncbi:MAG: PDZ domain-containing protein, partial [Deltaproteobacteria bacterium]|nr:PDZ domain-containing protein [Deltaproteobacteria bacterium]
IDRNLFGAAVKEQPTTPKQIETEKLQHTTLNVSLLGTVSGDTENATAVIQDKAKRSQDLYKVGDTIQNATIVEILRRKVVLRLGDKNQILTMEENRSSSSPTRGKRQVQTRRAQPSTPVSRSTISLDPYEADKSLSDINKVLTQVRVRPAYKDGKRDGLLLTNIRPNTIFTQLKLRNGDIIQSVDGDEIRRPEDIINFYDQLKSGYPVSLSIKRRGEEKILNYIFE